MEVVYRFSLLLFKPSNAPPPFVIPAKAGIQRRANGKTRGENQEKHAINQNAPDLDSRFRGNDGKRDCVYTAM